MQIFTGSYFISFYCIKFVCDCYYSISSFSAPMPSTPKKNKTITDSVMKSVTMPLIIVEDECNVSQDQTFITEAQQPTNCESMNRAQAEDYLRSLMKVREVKVEIQFEMVKRLFSQSNSYFRARPSTLHLRTI